MRQFHFWISTIDPETGKRYLIYGCPERGGGENEARQKGMEMLSGLDFKLHRFPTMDKDSASAMLRGKRISAGQPLGEVSRRIGHERSLRRLKRRSL